MSGQSDSLIVTEDGLADLGDSIENIIFHQNLNVFIVTTKDNSVRVFDPHSSLKLADVPLGQYVPEFGERIQCMYHGETGGLILSGGKSIGVRQDHQGVLLLNTILQTQVASQEDTVTLEILLSEALQLQQVFWVISYIEHAKVVKDALMQAIAEPLAKPCSNPKVGKWRTVCLTLRLGVLRSVCQSIVAELRHRSYFIPALSLTSALYHRLNHLSPTSLITDGSELDKDTMFSESERLSTFTKWPHMNYKWALPDQMAQAGFFHQPVASDDDRAICFICNVCLVYWEPTDEPWSEHERHSPNCPYVKGEYTHNVPLSVTHATSPAMTHTERAENIHRISISNSKLFVASSTSSGNIAIWNVAKQLKKEITFLVDPSDSTILDKHFSDTIGYTDVPLQTMHPKEVWQSLPAQISHTNPESQPLTSDETFPSSSDLMPQIPSLMDNTDTLINSGSGVASMDLEIEMEYINEFEKDFFFEQNSSFQFDNPSENVSPFAPQKKLHKTLYSSVEQKSAYPVDDINDIHCIDLQDVLLLDDLNDISLTMCSADSVKVSAASSSEMKATESVCNTNLNPKNVEFSLETVSDELFAPPRPSQDVRVTSLCVFADPAFSQSLSSAIAGKKSQRACLAVGVGLRRYDLFSTTSTEGLVQVLNDVNEATCKEPLDIMKLETLPESQSDLEGRLSESDSPSSDHLAKQASNPSSSAQCPKNFVPYLLIYDLSPLAQSHTISLKQNTKVVNQGTSKKSTRKATPTYPLVKLKGEIPYENTSVDFPLKNKPVNKSIPCNLPNENSSTPKKVPKCTQCIPLPHKLNKLKLHLFVDLILISPCGQYLLVSLQQFKNKLHKQYDSARETEQNAYVKPSEKMNFVGGFILYAVCSSDESLSLQEEPIKTNLFTNWNLVPKDVVMIPNMPNEREAVSGSLAGVICLDGNLRILSLTSLNYVHEVVPQEKFNSITYCHSLERLCVTRENGNVVLMQVKGNEDLNEESELSGDGNFYVTSKDCKSDSAEREIDLQSDELLVNKGMTEENLDNCLELTQFQAGCPRFVATVPPCWAEVIQAQKKRRNPQHLQHQSEEVDTARTWRLESDRSTFDEHMLDILLPLPNSAAGTMQIGHVDIKLNLVSGVTHPLPKIQITLLKQNLKSTRKSALPKPLDNYLELPDNPVRTREFLLTHKAEILCGPVTVNQFIDLSGQAANLTLTSPELFACKGRSFLIHIKAIKSSYEQENKDSDPASVLDLLPQYVPPQSNAFFDKLTSSSANTKRGEAPKGCDIIQELTLTIHCCAKTNIPHERLQRLAMIEKQSFHSELISAIVSPSSSQHIQHRALDILLWILCIHTASEQESSQRKELISLLQDSLAPFVRTCILGGDRSFAHKVTKIILTSMESLPDTECRREFGESVLSALLKFLDSVAKCKSAGAVYWFFSLLNHVKWCDPLATAEKVTELLSVTSEILSAKIHPIHSLLQTNLGLYGMPFERELFDTFPTLLMKQSAPLYPNSNNSSEANQHHNPMSASNGNSNLGNSHNAGSSWNKDCVPWYGTSTSAKNSFGGVLSPLGCGDNCDLGVILGQSEGMLGLTPQIGGLCGLFEVEPLHFTLHLASDGTKMERVFPGSGYAANPYIIHPAITGDTDSGIMTDNLKVPPTPVLHKAVEDMEQIVLKNQAVTLLLSKKAKKSCLEKLKKTAKQMTGNCTHLASLDSLSTVVNKSVQNGDSNASLKENTKPSSASAVATTTVTTSSTPSTLSSDTSPEGGIPPSSLMDKQALSNSNLPSEILGNIVEGVANSIFSNSMLNSSLDLLANVTNDEISDPLLDNMLFLEVVKACKMPQNAGENHFSDKEGDYDWMINKLNVLLQSEILNESDSNQKAGKNDHTSSVSKFAGSEQETDKDKLEKTLAEIANIESAADTAKTTSTTTTAKVPEDSITDATTAVNDSTTDTTIIVNDSGKPPSATPGVLYQQLLSIPPQQMIVIERMHSGARRFVILDFGAPVILTDIIIPACGDLVSLTIDIWLNGEETDGERLAVASDIGLRPLVLADLQPPPLCRFLKVTTLGRYGMVTSQCRIPVGAFYGHTIILPWHLQPSQPQVAVTTKKMAKAQLSILSSMVEDVSCRYSLACSKLKSILLPHCKASSGAEYPSLGTSPPNSANAIQEKKILLAYQECLSEQQHLNLIIAVMRRLQKFLGISPSSKEFSSTPEHHVTNGNAASNFADYRKALERCSTDQLSTIVQNLLNCLLTLSYPPPSNDVQMKLFAWCGPEQAKALIENVCIREPKGTQVAVVSLLARLCTTQPWWGEFLSSTLVALYTTGESNHFPATRMFALLTFLGQKSVQCGRGTHVIDAVLQALLNQLRKGGFSSRDPREGTDVDHTPYGPQWLFGGTRDQIDPKLISWLLLFLSLCLDLVAPSKGNEGEKTKEGGRWSWLTAESSLQKKGSNVTKTTPKASRELLMKRLIHHQQQLVNLQSAATSFGEVLAGLGNVINPKMFKQSEQVFKKIQKQHAMKHYKDLCSIQRNETSSFLKRSRNNASAPSISLKANKDDTEPPVTGVIAPVGRDCCLAVTKALIKLLMNTRYPCSVDTFLLTCKVIGSLVRVTRPCLRVSEFLSEEQLTALLTHCMTLDSVWGSPWAIHAFTCLLQDVLEGEQLYGSIVLNIKPSEQRETNATDSNKGGQPSDQNDDIDATFGMAEEPLQTDDLTTTESNQVTSIDNSSNLLSPWAGETKEIVGESSSFNQESASSDITGEGSPVALKSKEREKVTEEETVTVATTSASTSVTSSNQANQSATAISPPAVSVATSHFANLVEEAPGKYTFLESDETSGSDDMIDFLSEFQYSDLGNAQYSYSSGLNNMGPMVVSMNVLPNPFCLVGCKLGSKDSRVGDLMTAPLASQKLKLGPDHSTAVDARLENGISLTAELRTHMMNAIHASRLCSAVSAPLQVSSGNWGNNEMFGTGDLKESVDLLSLVFQNTLTRLAYKFEGNQLESVLEIWLSLNLDLAGSEYNSSIVPLIPLNLRSISDLLSSIVRSQHISIRCWCLVLQTLTLCSNLYPPEEGIAMSSAYSFDSDAHDQFGRMESSWMAHAIVCDGNFIPVLQKLLSGHCSIGTITRYDVVGSTLTTLLEDFLVRLQVICDVLHPNSVPGNNLKLSLLKLVMRLLEPDTPLSRGLGPLDIQKTLLTIMLSMHYIGLHKTHIPLTIINSVAYVVDGFLSSSQDVTPGSPEQNSSVLGGLFASVLGSDGQQGPTPTRKMILFALLNLARRLVEIPLEPIKNAGVDLPNENQQGPGVQTDSPYNQHCLTDSLKLEQKQLDLASSQSSQTDEHKAMNTSLLSGETDVEENLNADEAMNTRGSSDGARNRASNQLGKECCHSRPNKTVYIADSVLQNSKTMNLLLHSLRSCECNSAVPINLISMVSGEASETFGIGKTLSDALYQLLFTLNQKATDSSLLLNAILRYIRPNNFLCQQEFSEALFCFYTQVLDCEALLSKFATMNGTELLWENLVKSVGTFGGPQTGLISSVMNHLSPPLPQSTMSPTSVKRVDPATGSPSTVINSNPRGLYNFAPLAVVTSSNPTARPASALVKPTQLFQRSKNPPWSYHLYPEENWVDLNLTLPCPILLHEVLLQPHTMSLGMCPSGVSLEAGIEGNCLIPVTGLICTAGLTAIHIALKHPIVASVVVVRLHRSRDQTTIGLSHLKLLGTTAFKSVVASKDVGWDQGPQKSSYWWLRLVDHCMFDVPGGFNLMLEAGGRVEGVMEAMITLLATSSTQPSASTSSASLGSLAETLTNNNCQLIHTLSSTLIENTTLALVSYNQDLLHTLVRCLFDHPLMMQPSGSSSVDAAVALLCTVSTTMDGIKLLIDWFTKIIEYQSGIDLSSRAERRKKTLNPEILHCFAAILWNVCDEVAPLITDSLFKNVYTWCEKATSAVKEGLDYIICSLCNVQPHFFTQLLLYMGFLTVTDSSSSSVTDNGKDREAEFRASCTDDMKETGESCGLSSEGRLILQDPSLISITSNHLQTVSFAAQSPIAIHLLLDSGFPLLLVHGILEWCKAELLQQVESCTTPTTSESATDHEKTNNAGPSSTPSHSSVPDSSSCPKSNSSSHQDALPALSTNMVVHILESLAALCSEMPMKDWLGSGEGSVFWIPLLTVLGDPVMHGSEMSMRTGCDSRYGNYSQVEDATIRLMKECCNNHEHNQKLLASTLCHLIKRQNTPPPGGLSYLHSLSGFTRRLVLQILLEAECVLVHVTSTFCLSQPPLYTFPPHLKHPKFGAGNKTRLMYLPVTTKVEDVIRMVTDWGQQGLAQNQPASSGENGSNNDVVREIREVGLELVDKLSVAAGVTAKDKRMKDKGLAKGPNKGLRKNRRRDSGSQSKKDTCGKMLLGSTLLPSYGLTHEDILGGSAVIPKDLTLAQILAALWHHNLSATQNFSQLKFNLLFARDACQDSVDGPAAQSLLKTVPRPSMLSVFSSQGGLSILAQHMALLYPDTSPQCVASLSSKNGADDKKEKNMDYFVGFNLDTLCSVQPEFLGGNSMNNSPGFVRSNSVGLFSVAPIPPHALGSFTLFLRLPGYAETLLQDNAKACCLLRLALGVYCGFYEGDSPSFIGSLVTLPFQVLEVLLKSTPLTTDDGLMLRKMCLSTGVLHLILACLAALSHQEGPDVIASLQHPNVPIGLVVATARASCPQRQNGSNSRIDNDKCHYWAKGTGFGTGSMNQSWNVEQALIKQKMEEEHVVWLIKLLAQYINPGDSLPEDIKKECQEEISKVLQSDNKESTTPASSVISTSSSTSNSSPSPLLVPQTSTQSEESVTTLPPDIYDLFLKAGLVSRISCYLSNDSVLDMSRHIPLYQSLMALVRAIAVTPSLCPLFLSPFGGKQEENLPDSSPKNSGPSLASLLTKMKTTVNTYMEKLKWKATKTVPNTRPRKVMTSNTNLNEEEKVSVEMSDLQTVPEEGENEDQGLSLLVPDIQLSSKVVEIVMKRLNDKETSEKLEETAAQEEPEAQSAMDIYLNVMKPLQFDCYEMIVEDADKGIRFVVPYHYENLVRDAGEVFNPRRMKRLAQEAVTLSMSLPLSYSSSVFVRTDMDRLDVMKVLITGPEDTPYANGCFEFDVYFSNNYPNSPLFINLQTTGEKRVRFNPNLYQDGKVCLSILNTWHGRPEEKWNPQTSSLLQVLVSIQSLILVPEPYFNEPGYERSRGSQAALHNSQEYDANIKAETVRWAILNQLRNPSPCFKEVIERHFWLKQNDVLAQIESWITELETLSKNKRAGRIIPHHAMAIKKMYHLLAEDFWKMSPPKGLENVPMPSPKGLENLPFPQSPSPPLGAQSSSLLKDEVDSSGSRNPARRVRKPSRANLLSANKPHVTIDSEKNVLDSCHSESSAALIVGNDTSTISPPTSPQVLLPNHFIVSNGTESDPSPSPMDTSSTTNSADSVGSQSESASVGLDDFPGDANPIEHLNSEVKPLEGASSAQCVNLTVSFKSSPKEVTVPSSGGASAVNIQLPKDESSPEPLNKSFESSDFGT